jgi:predicted RNase H-like HicB family nuclease
MKVTALIGPTRTGYCGHVLDFGGHGIIAVGDTADEVANLLQEAAEDMIAELRDEGRPLPTIREEPEPPLENGDEIRKFDVG